MSDGLVMTKSGDNSVSDIEISEQVQPEVQKQDPFPQMPLPYPNPVEYRKPVETLPPGVAIPAGLAQVFIGGSMVVCGSFALRYRSYLFYYGSGLWAGTLAGICGALAVLATKQGPPKPRWLCGGRKWQIHIFILSAMLALTANVLVSLFSTSGLMQDTQYPVAADAEPLTKDEEIFEQRKSYGIAINAILLLLAMLEILLSFCSLGIALRVLCRSEGATPFSSDSAGSEVTMRDILGTGPEYEARKDRLLRWLGHQRRNFFLNSTLTQKNGKDKSAGLVPHFVAISPSQTHPQPHPMFAPPGFPQPSPQRIVYHHSQPVIPYTPGVPRSPYGFPVYPVPICPLPVRRPKPPTVVCLSSGSRGPRRLESLSGSSSSCSKSKRSLQSTKNKKRATEKNKEITEEEIGKTYTGLDRVAAEDFISNTMNKY